MKLAIYSLKKILFQGEASSINCKTAVGEVTILDHHRALISTLAPGPIKIVDNKNKMRYIQASSGFLEVSGNTTKLLVEE